MADLRPAFRSFESFFHEHNNRNSNRNSHEMDFIPLPKRIHSIHGWILSPVNISTDERTNLRLSLNKAIQIEQLIAARRALSDNTLTESVCHATNEANDDEINKPIVTCPYNVIVTTDHEPMDKGIPVTEEISILKSSSFNDAVEDQCHEEYSSVFRTPSKLPSLNDNYDMNEFSISPSDQPPKISVCNVENGKDSALLIKETNDNFQHNTSISELCIREANVAIANADTILRSSPTRRRLFNDSTSPIKMVDKLQDTTTTRTQTLNARTLSLLSALAHGFLTRKLMRSRKVQNLASMVRDLNNFLHELAQEQSQAEATAALCVDDNAGVDTSVALRKLEDRVRIELASARSSIHHIFMDLSSEQRLTIIRRSREQDIHSGLRQRQSINTNATLRKHSYPITKQEATDYLIVNDNSKADQKEKSHEEVHESRTVTHNKMSYTQPRRVSLATHRSMERRRQQQQQHQNDIKETVTSVSQRSNSSVSARLRTPRTRARMTRHAVTENQSAPRQLGKITVARAPLAAAPTVQGSSNNLKSSNHVTASTLNTQKSKPLRSNRSENIQIQASSSKSSYSRKTRSGDGLVITGHKAVIHYEVDDNLQDHKYGGIKEQSDLRNQIEIREYDHPSSSIDLSSCVKSKAVMECASPSKIPRPTKFSARSNPIIIQKKKL